MILGGAPGDDPPPGRRAPGSAASSSSASGGSDGRRAPLGFAARAPRPGVDHSLALTPALRLRVELAGALAGARADLERALAAQEEPRRDPDASDDPLSRENRARRFARYQGALAARRRARRGGGDRGGRGGDRGGWRGGASPRTRGWIFIPAAAPRAIGPSRVRRGARRAFGRRRRAKGRLPPGPGLSSGGGSPRILRERDARHAETTTGFPAVVVVAASFPRPRSSGGASERRVPFRV